MKITVSKQTLQQIISLTAAPIVDDLSSTTVTKIADVPAAVKLAAEMRAAKLAEEKSAATESLAELIIQLEDLSQKEIDSLVDEIRQVRQREKTMLSRLSKITKARTFMVDTANVFPLLTLLDPALAVQLSTMGVKPEQMDVATEPKALAVKKTIPSKAPAAK